MSFYKNKGAVKSKAINLSEEESIGHGSWVVQIYRSTEYEGGSGGNSESEGSGQEEAFHFRLVS